MQKVLSFHLVPILYDPGIVTLSPVPQTPKYITDRPIYAALWGRGSKMPKICDSIIHGWSLRRTMGNIATNHVIHIPPEPLKTLTESKEFYQVPIPSSHIGEQNVCARLLSPFRTVDMIGDCKSCFRKCFCKVS